MRNYLITVLKNVQEKATGNFDSKLNSLNRVNLLNFHKNRDKNMN